MQGLLGGKVAVYRRCQLARDHIGVEEHLQGRLLAQLAQRCAQRLGLDMNALGSVSQRQRGTDGERQGQRHPARIFFVVHGEFFHVEPSPVIARVRGC